MCTDQISALAQVITTIVVFLGVIVALYQLREMARASKGQAFAVVVQQLQAPDVRNARRMLIRLKKTSFDDWTNEEKETAELACSTFDTVGIMARNGLIGHALIAGEWRNAIVRCWEQARPMVIEYRETRGKDYWDDFEWLYEKAASGREHVAGASSARQRQS